MCAAVALVASSSGCGARWNEEQRAAIQARHVDGASVASRRSANPGTANTATSVAVGSPTTIAAAAAVGAGAPASGRASGGPEGSSGTGGAAPCAAPSHAPGVTDREIQVASISSLSGPVPGLGASSAAARAYVAYRNSTGGVCGRQIVLRQADDGTDNGRYRSIVTELGPKVLGVAGGFALGDVGGADIVRAQGLPIVGAPSGEAAAQVPTVFDVNPNLDDPHAVLGKYRWLREQGVSTVAIAYIAVDQSRYEAQLQRGLMEAAGIRVVLQRELPLSTLSYDATARAVANSRADYLWFVADINGEAAMAHSMADTGYHLKVAEYFNFAYGTNFTELAGAAADGTIAFLRSLPNEEADSNKELGTFVHWMHRIAPGANLDPFAVDSWVAAKAFFDTLQALPGPISRESFVAQLGATKTYDAGGMYGPIRLGAKRSNGCVVATRYSDGVWRRVAPETGFLC